MIQRRVAVVLVVLVLLPVLGAVASDRDLFDEGERRFAAANYTLAIERFERLLSEFPGSSYRTRANVRVAQSLFYLGDLSAALDRLQRTAVRAQGGALSGTIQFWIGLTSFQLGDYPLAEASFSRYLAGEDGFAGRALLYRGLSRLELGRVSEGHQDLREAVERAAGTEREYAAAVLMESLAASGEVDAVRAVFDAVQPVEGTSPYGEMILRYAADAARRAGDLDAAVPLYRRLAEGSVDSAQWAYRHLYAFARDRNDREAMQQIYRQAEQRLALEPERLADFWFSLGADALERDRFELAELYLSRVWEVRDQRRIDGAVPLYLAWAMEEQSRNGEALELLTESLADSWVADDYRDDRAVAAARLHISAGEFDAAATLLESEGVEEVSGASLYLWAFSRMRLGAGSMVLERLRREEVQPLLREYPALIRMRGRLYLDSGDAIEAVRSYRMYLAEAPQEIDARIELIRALAVAEQFPAVTREIELLDLADVPVGRRDEISYLGAIAAFHEEDYQSAAAALREIDDPAFEPVRSYHLGWSLYRLGEISEARRAIGSVVDDLPPALESDGRYLYAWTLYRQGRSDDARTQLLRTLGRPVSWSEEVRTRRLLAAIEVEAGRFDDALTHYAALARGAENPAEQGRYQLLIATTLAGAGRLAEAVGQYDEIAVQYSTPDTAGTALLEAGELLYGMESLRQARERFREYRGQFPEGPEVDRALYWAGLTSWELDEAGRALLWWEPLINEFPRSEYTPDVLFLTAGIYAARDQRREALELYDRLVAAYPDSFRADDAERLRRTIRLELDGLSAREAELWVELEPGGGGGPPAGEDRWFELVLRLGRIAIREQITLTRERARIVDLLLEATTFDGPSAAEASLLLAEYYRRRGETNAAVRRYVEAAGTPGAPDELRAQSLYELAVLAGRGGDEATAADAIAELRSRYPDSIWSDRARAIMEANR
jgi:TolA-binding protein